MINWDHVKILEKSQVIETLKNKRLPRPRFWRQLLRLWDYVSAEVTGFEPTTATCVLCQFRGKRITLRGQRSRPARREASSKALPTGSFSLLIC